MHLNFIIVTVEDFLPVCWFFSTPFSFLFVYEFTEAWTGLQYSVHGGKQNVCGINCQIKSFKSKNANIFQKCQSKDIHSWRHINLWRHLFEWREPRAGAGKVGQQVRVNKRGVAFLFWQLPLDY